MKNKKIVWITGASSGIGKELSYKFAQKGWKIALTARRKDKLETDPPEQHTSGVC